MISSVDLNCWALGKIFITGFILFAQNRLVKQFVRPVVGISKCLEFDSCRYDGKILNNELIRKMKQYVDFLPVCPEVGIGLGTPRKAVRLVKIGDKKNLYQPSTDRNLTDQIKDFSEKFLNGITSIDGFILKHSSPTCGVRNTRLYHKIGKEVGYDQTTGIFTDFVIKKFPNLIIEDEARLRNELIRDSFLTRLFTMASLRNAMASESHESIQDFYLKNQMLFMCYDKVRAKNLGELVKKQDMFRINCFHDKLKQVVFDILNKIPNSESIFGSFMYIYNMFKDRLHNSERDHFDSLMRGFSKGLASYSEISTLLYSWALRFDLEMIQSQTIFNPYPKQLSYDPADRPRNHSVLKI